MSVEEVDVEMGSAIAVKGGMSVQRGLKGIKGQQARARTAGGVPVHFKDVSFHYLGQVGIHPYLYCRSTVTLLLLYCYSDPPNTHTRIP